MYDIFLPRGIRNNNPGNIRHGSSAWMGRRTMQTDDEFIAFDDPVFGLRALMRLLLSYRYKYSLRSVEEMIRRYAPPHENATDQYIFHVARALGVKRTAEIDLTVHETLVAFAAAIVRHENGKPPAGKPEDWYAPDVYDRAATLALYINERKTT